MSENFSRGKKTVNEQCNEQLQVVEKMVLKDCFDYCWFYTLLQLFALITLGWRRLVSHTLYMLYMSIYEWNIIERNNKQQSTRDKDSLTGNTHWDKLNVFKYGRWKSADKKTLFEVTSLLYVKTKMRFDFILYL